MRNWQIELGFIPGILFGVRTYTAKEFNTHVFYFFCLDIALIIENLRDEE